MTGSPSTFGAGCFLGAGGRRWGCVPMVPYFLYPCHLWMGRGRSCPPNGLLGCVPHFLNFHLCPASGYERSFSAVKRQLSARQIHVNDCLQ